MSEMGVVTDFLISHCHPKFYYFPISILTPDLLLSLLLPLPWPQPPEPEKAFTDTAVRAPVIYLLRAVKDNTGTTPMSLPCLRITLVSFSPQS